VAAWIPSPNYYKGRRRPLAFIVMHSTESPERVGGARSVAKNWFALPSSKVSAHVVVDADEVVECVKPQNTAWHCANGNADGYGIEIVGRATQTADDWSDDYSLAAIRNAGAWIRSVPALAGIPARWLTDDQLKRRRERGLTTHLQVSRVLGGTDAHRPRAGVPARLRAAADHGGRATTPCHRTELTADARAGRQRPRRGVPAAVPQRRAVEPAAARAQTRRRLRPEDGRGGPRGAGAVRRHRPRRGRHDLRPADEPAFWARGYRG
jgi:hypothetical protein